MITSANLETCQFVSAKAIYRDVIEHFGMIGESASNFRYTITDQEPWTWGDTNRVMVGNNEFVEFLIDVLNDLDYNDSEIDVYCANLLDFLVTQGASVDVTN
jgi:hypothetical protein